MLTFVLIAVAALGLGRWFRETLAFLVNQVEQHCCPLFRAASMKLGSKRALWDQVRSHFRHFRCDSMQRIYEAILYDLTKNLPLPGLNSS